MIPVSLSTYQLEACKGWKLPTDSKILPVSYVIPFLQFLAAGQTQRTFEQAIVIPGGYPFSLIALGAWLAQPGPKMRFQWPNGRYLSNVLMPIFGFIQTGKSGRLLAKPVDMKSGDVVRMDIDNTAGPAQTLMIFFEGVAHIPFAKGGPNAGA